jgi:peptidoglycan hydrolase-like protein with peptidoglycan-binding domain
MMFERLLSLLYQSTALLSQKAALINIKLGENFMVRNLFFVFALFLVFATTAAAQNANSSSTNTATSTKNTNASKKKRGPVFRATKDQIMQAQAILKERGLYMGEQTGKLDDPTRAALKEYQKAEGLKATGTLNKVTLEKMNIALTDKQKTM